MQMMQPIALPGLVLQETSKCWFCEKKPKKKRKNKEKESPASPTGRSAGPENAENNDASALGRQLKSRPTWSIAHKVDASDPIEQGEHTNVVPAAHHLLPGGASVNKATQLHKYMVWKGKNPLNFNGPIGYNINCYQNGVWLPGNYAVRKDTDFGKNWGKFQETFKSAYAKAAMQRAGNLQLHDAHPAYNSNVKKTLIDVAKKLDAQWTDRSKCPICKKKLDNQGDPPFGLVGRLHRLSGEHRKALIFPRPNKKALLSGYVTSSRVLSVYT